MEDILKLNFLGQWPISTESEQERQFIYSDIYKSRTIFKYEQTHGVQHLVNNDGKHLEHVILQ